jgi:hypothetical protein
MLNSKLQLSLLVILLVTMPNLVAMPNANPQSLQAATYKTTPKTYIHLPTPDAQISTSKPIGITDRITISPVQRDKRVAVLGICILFIPGLGCVIGL